MHPGYFLWVFSIWKAGKCQLVRCSALTYVTVCVLLDFVKKNIPPYYEGQSSLWVTKRHFYGKSINRLHERGWQNRVNSSYLGSIVRCKGRAKVWNNYTGCWEICLQLTDCLMGSVRKSGLWISTLTSRKWKIFFRISLYGVKPCITNGEPHRFSGPNVIMEVRTSCMQTACKLNVQSRRIKSIGVQVILWRILLVILFCHSGKENREHDNWPAFQPKYYGPCLMIWNTSSKAVSSVGRGGVFTSCNSCAMSPSRREAITARSVISYSAQLKSTHRVSACIFPLLYFLFCCFRSPCVKKIHIRQCI